MPQKKSKTGDQANPLPNIAGGVEVKVPYETGKEKVLDFLWSQKGGVTEFILDYEGQWGGPFVYAEICMTPLDLLSKKEIKTGLRYALDIAHSKSRHFSEDIVEALDMEIYKAPIDEPD